MFSVESSTFIPFFYEKRSLYLNFTPAYSSYSPPPFSSPLLMAGIGK